MNSLKVLLLEDQQFQLMAMHQMLNAIGIFNVITADGADNAIQLLEKHGKVDIAICDLHMEGADGLDLIRYLGEAQCVGGLIIASSAEPIVLSSVAHMARGYGVPLLGCLEKPASALRFRLLIDRFLEQGPRLEPGLPQLLVEELVSEEEVRKALREKQLTAYFQPKVSINGQVVGVEALVRWQHSKLGMLSPAQFLPIVEYAGLSNQLTWFMLEQSLELASRLSLRDGSPLPVAVNIAPDILLEPDFSRRVLSLVAEHDLSPEILTIEIVESAFSTPAPARIEALARLRMSGCKVAIDDFGTGASNMQRLSELPVSDLKIPAEFVKGIGREVRLNAIVEGAIVMAARMGLDVTVEGVDSLEDYEALSLLGEPFVQGYFIARPMSEAGLGQWLSTYTGRLK